VKTTKNGRTQLPDTMGAAEIGLLRSSPTSITKTAGGINDLSVHCSPAETIPLHPRLEEQKTRGRHADPQMNWREDIRTSAPPRHRRTGGCALHRRRPCSNRPDGHSCPKLGWATATLVPLGHHARPHWASVQCSTGPQAS
jgi:hypothetical protein